MTVPDTVSAVATAEEEKDTHADEATLPPPASPPPQSCTRFVLDDVFGNETPLADADAAGAVSVIRE